MGVLDDVLRKLGYGDARRRSPLRVFLLDDDAHRHDWFARRFRGDRLDVAAEPRRAIELLSENSYDAIFLDHDLLPEHYDSDERDDERTGYAVANWLAERPERQSASHIIVHTRNADGALRMVELLRRTGRYAEHVPFQMLPQKIKSYWRR
ncbi:MAG TPA: cyclic-phosphate processing receiver domain-containing protein [Pyrinomonadaceae bacterium]|nr:cyclic-phosphate processing receiver domain-containing protein [Pyrinomonadaceae bacterium]